MQSTLTSEQIDELHLVVDRMLGREPEDRPPTTILGSFDAPFPTHKQNSHDSKKEFLAELAVVEEAIAHLDGMLTLTFPNEDDDADQEAIKKSVLSAIEVEMARSRPRKYPTSASDLAFSNLKDTGFAWNSLRVMFELKSMYEKHFKELKDQEKQFWNVAHRAPNYYARTIALRLARLYAEHKRMRPTFGISREGNFPSTDFGRALEDVFKILGIKARVRGAAEWAIGELTDAEVNPPMNIFAALQNGTYASEGKNYSGNAFAEIARMTQKGR